MKIEFIKRTSKVEKEIGDNRMSLLVNKGEANIVNMKVDDETEANQIINLITGICDNKETVVITIREEQL